ncbi:MAG: hypothetical protein J5916_10820, partial [Oscillospiraceae bacterium]|nr:hypothetical protein [Oscillospiraceae bacterium]
MIRSKTLKNLQRALALVMALNMFIGCPGFTAFAEEDEAGDHTHDWQLAEVKEPSCTEPGYETHLCSICQETHTHAIDPLGHTPGEAQRENEVPATCIAEGSCQEVVFCTVCGAELSREMVALPILDHSWDEGVVRVEPTTESEGERVYTCLVCGAEKSEVIERLSVLPEDEPVQQVTPALIPEHVHNYVVAETKEPVCEEQG